MEQLLDADQKPHKIYQEKAIWVAAFFGGPLAAGYLIAENFKAFNEHDRYKKTWIITITFTVAVIGGLFAIPEDVNVPNHLIPFVYTLIAYLLVQRFQGQNIRTHLNAGGKLYGWGRSIAVGLIGLIITLVPLFTIALLSDGTIDLDGSSSTKTYGSLQHEITFDRKNISEAEVDQLARGLTEVTFFDQTDPKYVFAEKADNTYVLSLSVIEDADKDEEIVQAFAGLRDDLQKLYPNKKIIIKLASGTWDNVIKTIE